MNRAAPKPSGTATTRANSPTRIVPHSSDAMPKVPASGSHWLSVKKLQPCCWIAGQAPMNRKTPIRPMMIRVEIAEDRIAATKVTSDAEGCDLRTRRPIASTTGLTRGGASSPVVIRSDRSRSRGCARPAGRSKISSVGPCSTMWPGWFSVARKNAQRFDTRWAWCMLCVTMTTVTSLAIARMVSSTRRVDVGSSAEHGSSIRSTPGFTASARAMHSRCCWPPDSDEPGCCQAVLDLVPEAGADQAALDQVVQCCASCVR